LVGRWAVLWRLLQRLWIRLRLGLRPPPLGLLRLLHDLLGSVPLRLVRLLIVRLLILRHLVNSVC
jgi:hypothetical protein